MLGTSADRDGLDYIYFGAIAAAVAAIFLMIAMVAGGSVAATVIGVLGGLALLAAGGLWVIGFGRYKAYYRAALGYGPPLQQTQFPGPMPPPPPPPTSHVGREPR